MMASFTKADICKEHMYLYPASLQRKVKWFSSTLTETYYTSLSCEHTSSKQLW